MPGSQGLANPTAMKVQPLYRFSQKIQSGQLPLGDYQEDEVSRAPRYGGSIPPEASGLARRPGKLYKEQQTVMEVCLDVPTFKSEDSKTAAKTDKMLVTAVSYSETR